MDRNKLMMLTRMSLDKRVIRNLHRTYRILNEDKHFNRIKYIKMLSNMIKGEKIIQFKDQYIISTFMPPFPSKAFYTNIKAVNHPKDDIFTQQIYAKRSAPISMYLCLTHKCPNNCLYCSARNRTADKDKDLTTDEWVKVIKDLQDMNTSIIGLTGGEPMIRDDLYEIIQAIDKRSTAILFTSGYNLTLEKAKALKKSGLFSIGISLDSFSKEVHNQNRKDQRAFDWALKALRNARKAGLYTMVQTVILKENVNEDHLFRLFKLAKDNGAHEVKILEPILSGNLLNETNLENILYDEVSRKRLIEIQHRANKIKSFPKISTFAYTESEEKFGCGAGNQHSYISASGDLYPCDFVPMRFGNVRDESIKTLWQDMNAIIGIPKIGCFAQKVNREVYKKAEGALPLNKAMSSEICMKNQSRRFPKYYRTLQ